MLTWGWILRVVGNVVVHHDDDMVVGHAVGTHNLVGVAHVRLRAHNTLLRQPTGTQQCYVSLQHVH